MTVRYRLCLPQAHTAHLATERPPSGSLAAEITAEGAACAPASRTADLAGSPDARRGETVQGIYREGPERATPGSTARRHGHSES